jgi:co-chaperonin GroES (HSP10)|tara:strand:+ start:4053 stop:4649 length:597 start_codon:yes stop_codon:yes gene_type:complete
MRTFDLFIVKIEKRLKDTITSDSGFELYMDAKFDDFKNRTTEAPVVCVPFKYETGVEIGDTLYFHHLVVLGGDNNGQIFTEEDNTYIVKYDPEFAISNQAIAYKSKKDGKIRCLTGWCLLKSVEQEELSLQSETIEIVELTEKLPTKGEVVYVCQEAEDMGVSPGEVVGFKQNRDYRITIDGVEYYRTRAEDLMYAEI